MSYPQQANFGGYGAVQPPVSQVAAMSIQSNVPTMPSTSYGQPPPNGPSYFQPSSTSHSHVTAPFMPGTQPMGGGAMNAPPGHMHTGMQQPLGGGPSSSMGMTGPPQTGMTGPPPTGPTRMTGPGPTRMAGRPPTGSPGMTGPPPTGMTGLPSSGPTGMTGPPPTGMTGPPPTGMTGPQPTGITGPLPTGMTGPPPTGMTGPPPTGMTGPPPTGMTGPPPTGMTGPPPTGMTGPPPTGMTGPPPTGMTGPPPTGMTGPPPTGMTGPPPTGPTGMTGPPPTGMTGPPTSGPTGMSGPGFTGMTGPQTGLQRMTAPPLTGPTGMIGHAPAGMTGPPPTGPTGMLPPGMTGPPHTGMTGPPGYSHPGSHPQYGPPGGHGFPPTSGAPPGFSPTTTVPPGQAAGPVAPAPRRVDPDQMPSPVDVIEGDRESRGSTVYSTATRGIPPPLVTTDFVVQDNGCCNPRYMRSTMYTVPCSNDLLNNVRVPMGLIIQPMAIVKSNEQQLLLVDHGQDGPIRCRRCKAYMNPFTRFVDGGRQFYCPFCQFSSEVPQEFFCHLDHQGRRTDIMERPELLFGSVEYVATKDYCKEGRLPKPPAYIFMIDVSVTSLHLGLLSMLSQQMLKVLEKLPRDEGGSCPIQVGFVTYDKSLHFYNVLGSLAQPQMMVLTDVEEVFVPIVDGFLVSVDESRPMLETLFSQLPTMFAHNKESQVVLGPVVKAGLEALKAAGRPGKLFVFHSSLSTGSLPGALKNREDTKVFGSDKEKSLLAPQGNYYTKLAEECVQHGASVELFMCPHSYVDTATLGHFVNTTGGQLHYYPHFKLASDAGRLLSDLTNSITRQTGFDAVMRVRASTGLRPTDFLGALYMQNTTDIELGSIDRDKAIAVEIKHDDKLKEGEEACFQAALLYTNVFGQRRLRIHNLALSTSNGYGDIFRSCEINAIMNFFSKSITNMITTMNYKNIQETLTKQCSIILSCYRKHCSTPQSAGQLILPETLKLLPIYCNTMLKSSAFCSPPVKSIDNKCWLLAILKSMNIAASSIFIYPRLFPLHDLKPEETEMPTMVRCMIKSVLQNGVYLIENGLEMVLWIGQQVSPEFVVNVFGVNSQAEINVESGQLPLLDNPLSVRIRGVIKTIKQQRSTSMQLTICKQKDKSEIAFRRLLKEEQGPGDNMNYIEYLCHIHKEIRNILS
ncbi:protein transport protein Sec24D-like isoform X2 [Dysidea avara]|uniref:protein transport protein Sec24D-like isoform X2 n=1 Tax=Dysidea avara TaxID=196820 RepID=UPI0033198FBD